jgi:hypothetical protein
MRLVATLIIAACFMACTNGDAPVEPNGRLCGTTMTSSGSFTPDPTAMPNPNGTGCWPYGTWTFTMTVDMNDCASPPQLAPQYQMKATQMINNDGDIVPIYSYLTDPANPMVIVKVSEGGVAGGCEGELDIYSNAGKDVFVLKPQLNADNSITGDGEYTEYGTNQWPF